MSTYEVISKKADARGRLIYLLRERDQNNNITGYVVVSWQRLFYKKHTTRTAAEQTFAQLLISVLTPPPTREELQLLENIQINAQA